MNSLERCRNAAMALVLCTACSSSITEVSNHYAATAVIGPNGGTLTVTAAENAAIAGTSITIPPGALSAPTTIEIGATNQSVVSSGALGPVIDFEPSGLSFAKPATMSIPLALPSGLSASRVAVLAVEANGTSRAIAPVSVANGLGTFQASGFTFFGAFESNPDGGDDSDAGNDSDAGCTPSCAGDATCGSSDGCGGTCNANCSDGGCTPSCGGDAGCGSSDGCGGTCNDACDAGCQPETDTFTVGPPKADVLFIEDVDDDAQEQSAITNAASDFFAAAGNIDYRIAVTTDNDYAPDEDAELGRLLPCSDCSLSGSAPTIISPSSVPDGGTAADPTTVFVQLYSSVPNEAYPTGTPVDEHFFKALYNALRIGPQPGVDFFRPGVFFAAITDNGDNETDSSVLGAGNHDPAWYAAFFEAYFPNPYLFTWNYINPTQTVTGTGFSDLLQEPPAIQQMLTATNGFAINSSDAAWTTALGSVWTSAITASTYYVLLGVPSEGQSGMVVTVNGTQISEFAGPGEPNWTYQATLNAIVFNPNTDPPALGAVITVTYPVVCGGNDSTGGCDVCDGGSCFSSCIEGDAPYCCGTTCVDEQSDSDNCGACGNVCASTYASGSSCVFGSCGCGASDFLCGAPGSGSCISDNNQCSDAGMCIPSCDAGCSDGCGGTCGGGTCDGG